MLSTSPQSFFIDSPRLIGLSLETVKEGDRLIMCNFHIHPLLDWKWRKEYLS